MVGPWGGIWSANPAFSTRRPTAQIFARDGTWHIVPMGKTAGGLFFARIEGRIYPFIVDPRAWKHRRVKGGLVVRTMLYSLDDIFPLEPADLKAVHEYIKANDMGPLGPEVAALVTRAYDMLRDLKGVPDNSVSVADLVEDVTMAPDVEAAVKKTISAIGHHKIAAPSPDVHAVLADRMRASPDVLITGIQRLKEEEIQWRQIAQPAKGPFGHWVLMAFIIFGAAALALGAALYADGSITFGGTPLPSDIDWGALDSQFGTPSDLPSGVIEQVPGLGGLLPDVGDQLPNAGAPPLGSPAVIVPPPTPPPPAATVIPQGLDLDSTGLPTAFIESQSATSVPFTLNSGLKPYEGRDSPEWDPTIWDPHADVRDRAAFEWCRDSPTACLTEIERVMAIRYSENTGAHGVPWERFGDNRSNPCGAVYMLDDGYHVGPCGMDEEEAVRLFTRAAPNMSAYMTDPLFVIGGG